MPLWFPPIFAVEVAVALWVLAWSEHEIALWLRRCAAPRPTAYSQWAEERRAVEDAERRLGINQD